MDGIEGKMSQSLQFKLSVWLFLVILIIALAGGAFSFVKAFQEANELQDDQLRQIAALINRYNLPLPSVKVQEAEPVADSDSRVIVQTLKQGDHQAAEPANDALALPGNLADGIQTVTVRDERWRVYVKTLGSGSQVAVAQQTAVRDEIARDGALQTVMPFAILIPLLLLVVGFLIKQMFMPVKKLALNLDRRSEQDLSQLSETHLPLEIVSFVVAINRLLSRVVRSVALQRRFVTDAAHELRSPLTALSLQAERLEAADMSAQARERLVTLKSGLQRTRVLLDQLLALARAQEPSSDKVATVSLQRILRQVLEDLMPLAESKSIDLGVIDGADATVAASEVDLQTLVKNLVDNAIRYTPDGGRIDLSVTASATRASLRVDDTGPGIAEEERERVFDPFYRVLGSNEIGSGLGLSIVKTIAERIGATVTLGAANDSSPAGLSVVVTFDRVS
jgi:two-component system OmpR family sensor kinase